MSAVRPNIAERAIRQLPDLGRLEQELRDSPTNLLPPDLQARFAPRAIVEVAGATAEGDVAPDPEVRQVLEDGARAVGKVRQEGEGADLTPAEATGLEAVIQLVGRPALLIEGGRFAAPPDEWRVLEEFREGIEDNFKSVGRIELKGIPGIDMLGTGFLVAEDIIMTNRHVAELFAVQGLSNNWKIKLGSNPFVDYIEERDAPASAEFRITEVVGIHPSLDLALLRVDHASTNGAPVPEPLKIASTAPDLSAPRDVYVVGYPATDNGGVTPPPVLLRIFSNIFRVKRLQPGKLRQVFEEHNILDHDCSTLGGNSGSCVVDLETGLVVGLHFRGEFRVGNHAVALWRLIDDPLLRNAGVNFD